MRVIAVDSLPADPLDALRELSRAGIELEALRRQRVGEARSEGATWEQIGESLGMSRQSAWEFYTGDARWAIDEAAEVSDLDEDEAMRVATEEVTRIRRRRRRRAEVMSRMTYRSTFWSNAARRSSPPP